MSLRSPTEGATRLETESFVDATPGQESRDVIDAFFAERGLRRRIACKVAGLTMIIGLVAAQLGIALVPESASLDPRLASARIADADLEYALKLAFPVVAALSSAALAFARHVSEALASTRGQASGLRSPMPRKGQHQLSTRSGNDGKQPARSG